MPTNPINIDYIRVLHLKKVGLVLASLWVIALIGAVSATIYREIDGRTVRSTVSENLNLAATNSALNESLDSARNANVDALGQLSSAQNNIDQLNADLQESQARYAEITKQLDSYLTSVPLINLPPDPWGYIATNFIP